MLFRETLTRTPYLIHIYNPLQLVAQHLSHSTVVHTNFLLNKLLFSVMVNKNRT
jgi:hypothetical protein